MFHKLTKPIVDKLATRIQGVELMFYPGAKHLKGFPRRLQMDDYSCGLQCVCMVLDFYGVAMPVREARKKLGLTQEGTDIDQLRDFFRQCGFRVSTFSRGYPKTLRNAIDRKTPVIVGMDKEHRGEGDHWAVVYGYRGRDFLVADPALSRSWLSSHSGERFQKRWDKTGLVIGPSARSGRERIKCANDYVTARVRAKGL